jgi:hypothetical protein
MATLTRKGRPRPPGAWLPRLVGCWLTAVVAFACLDVVRTFAQPAGSVIRHDAAAAFKIAMWVALSYAGFYALLAVVLVRHGRMRLCSSTSLSRAEMTRITLVSHPRELVVGGRILLLLLGLLGLVGFFSTRSIHLLALPILAISVRIWLGVRISTPPTILYLGTSTNDSVDRHAELKLLASPRRVVSLLDVTRDGRGSSWNHLVLDCLRNQDDDDWWAVVRALINSTPIIVVDGTAATPGVVRERDYLLEHGLAYKTIFVCDEIGRCALLDNTDCAPRRAVLHRLGWSAVQSSLRGIVESRAFPAPDAPIWKADDPSLASCQPIHDAPFRGRWNVGHGSERKSQDNVMWIRNPYKMIMMKCPETGRVIRTGINSAYFELWQQEPPPGGASCVCPECDKKHAFDKSNTWLDGS